MQSNIQLFQGDCLEVMKNIPDKSIDLIITSPPYDNLRDYNSGVLEWTENQWKPILLEIYRLTKEGGTVVWIVLWVQVLLVYLQRTSIEISLELKWMKGTLRLLRRELLTHNQKATFSVAFLLCCVQ